MTTILITDDHALIRASIRGQLRGPGDEVMSV
jgi:CheY-like chemotaxis protein